VAFYLWNGLAGSTRSTYSTGQKQFIEFVLLRPNLQNQAGGWLPATPEAVIEWVAHLGDRKLAPGTIKTYLSAVRAMHTDNGIAFEAGESVILSRVFRGIKRVNGAPANRKLPITLEILQSLASISNPLSSPAAANFDAAFKLGWAAFLRCGEFTTKGRFNTSANLCRSNIEFVPSITNPSHIKLFLPASKTDPFRRGQFIIVAAAPHTTTCPVSALQYLFTNHPLPPTSPLFIGQGGGPLSKSAFVARLRELLVLLHLDDSRYSGHSFRRGAATAAGSVGYSDYEIQQLGRWSSDCYRIYIDVPEDRILRLSAQLHGPSPVAPPPIPL